MFKLYIFKLHFTFIIINFSNNNNYLLLFIINYNYLVTVLIIITHLEIIYFFV